GQRLDAELGDEPGVGDGDEYIHGHDRGRRAGEPQQTPADRRGQKRMGQGGSSRRERTRAFRLRQQAEPIVWLSLAHASHSKTTTPRATSPAIMRLKPSLMSSS